ncbi:hypothetical protein MNR02_08715 [Shinella sp. H4-D48]|uniref:hypothetical protein n=1 Tax=Shinella sp. H4-D48 TaxID=2925841 RepID=UPI001F538CFD|nr:hypothetical protein [Shinella sp. H4-D48]UNK36595.1 hypothetical protein MNR02_08715 [Shinella sp. H4-D48]
MSESLEYPIFSNVQRREWVQDLQQILSQQETLLQAYRNYLIVLHSLMAAGAATLLVSLHTEFATWTGVIYQFANIGTHGVRALSSAIQYGLLIVFVCYAWTSLNDLYSLIKNRARNVTLMQRLLANIQVGKLRKVFPPLTRDEASNLSVYVAFKMVEGTEPNAEAFGIDDQAHLSTRDLWYGLKMSSDGHRVGGTRRKIDHTIVTLFRIVWVAMAAFILVVTVNAASALPSATLNALSK